MESTDVLIVGIENPLLDIQLDIETTDLLIRYGLTHGQACLAEEKHQALFAELWTTPNKITIPGGSSLNSVRAANHMIKDVAPGKCAFFGSIGNDEIGKTLSQELERTGVHGFFSVDAETPTGSCAVLIHEKERTLCANLAACLKYKTEHLLANVAVLEKAAFLYTSAFFITSNYEALKTYASFAAEHDKPLGYNLSACFLIQFNTEKVNEILEHADYVFCNEDEAKCFADTNKLEYSNLKDVALAISKWTKVNTKRARVAIITQGRDPILVAISKKGEDSTQHEFPIPAIEKDLIVDTNGAGDSFVGGFMSQIVQGKDLATAINAGIWLSGQVIQRNGCTFPETNSFR
jgi:adenosine kinase